MLQIPDRCRRSYDVRTRANIMGYIKELLRVLSLLKLKMSSSADTGFNTQFK